MLFVSCAECAVVSCKAPASCNSAKNHGATQPLLLLSSSILLLKMGMKTPTGYKPCSNASKQAIGLVQLEKFWIWHHKSPLGIFPFWSLFPETMNEWSEPAAEAPPRSHGEESVEGSIHPSAPNVGSNTDVSPVTSIAYWRISMCFSWSHQRTTGIHLLQFYIP